MKPCIVLFIAIFLLFIVINVSVSLLDDYKHYVKNDYARMILAIFLMVLIIKYLGEYAYVLTVYKLY